MHGKSNPRNPPLRVLMISQRLFPYIAGAEQQALGLARALVRAGARVRIHTTMFADGLPAHDAIDGIEVRRIAVPMARDVATSGPAFHAAKVAQIVAMALHVARQARSADVVHAHCLSASTLGAVIGARLAGTPVLVKPSLGGEDGELRKILISAAARPLSSILRRVDRFAVMSDEIAAELSSIDVAADRFSRVDNGIDLDRFCPATDDERRALRTRFGIPDGPLALFVGQYVPRKGVRELLAAWALLREQHESATLAFAGHGPDQPLIDAAVREAGGGIIDLGARSDVVDVIRASDLLVLPSRNESFGNVIVEALACGLPVIVGRTGVATQIDLDGVAGRFIDPESPSSIAAAIAEFLYDPARRVDAGARGRELVRRFDFERIAESYLEIYRDMVSSRSDRR
ncbi:MAG: glycosyltransferase family 4 protein [Blastocatellia bacterium]|nr:glycosyltransferase family 4 protein [Blastocatellia bacterium]